VKLGYEDIGGVVGVVPTPARDGADRWDAVDTVDLAQTALMTDKLIRAGVDIIMTTGTFGECASLTGKETLDFVDCILSVAAGRVPIFAGATTLNTRDTARRGRKLLDAGADGLFLGRPMWLALDSAGIVRYYRDMSEAFADRPLVVYDNPSAFKGKIAPDALAALADIREIVALKHIGGTALESDLALVGDRMRILPIDRDWARMSAAFPDTALACWSSNVACSPATVVALKHAIHSSNRARSEEITKRIAWAMAPLFPKDGFEAFMNFGVQLGHARVAGAGLIDPGPCRTPYVEVPEDYWNGGLACGRRWAELEREFAPAAV